MVDFEPEDRRRAEELYRARFPNARIVAPNVDAMMVDSDFDAPTISSEAEESIICTFLFSFSNSTVHRGAKFFSCQAHPQRPPCFHVA
jgi:hypothetical protein